MKRKRRILEEEGSPESASLSFHILFDFSCLRFIDCIRALLWDGIELQFAGLDTFGLIIYSLFPRAFLHLLQVMTGNNKTTTTTTTKKNISKR